MSGRSKPELTKARPAPEEPGRAVRRLQGFLRDAMDRFLGNDLLTGVLFVIALAVLVLAQQRGVSYGLLEVGQVAARDYYAPFAVEWTDLENTQKLKKEAGETSPPVYRFETSATLGGAGRLERFFEAGRRFFAAEFGEFASQQPLSNDDLAALRAKLPLAVEDDATLKVFVASRFSAAFEAVLRNAYEEVMRSKVAATPPILEKADHILILAQGAKTPFREMDRILLLTDAEARLVEHLKEPLREHAGGEALMAAFLRRLVDPNLIPDPVQTEVERREAVARVPDRVVVLPKGRVIAEKGEILTQQQISWLRDIESERTVVREYRVAGGALVILGLLVFFLRRYIRVHQREFKDRQSLFGMNMVVGLGVMLLSFALLLLSDVLAESFALDPFNRSLSYRFAIPVAAGALLMVLLTNARMAMVFSVSIAVTFGILSGWDLELVIYTLLGSFAGIYGVTQYRNRSAVLKAGLVVGGTNALTILALAAVADRLTPIQELLFDVACGLGGGILVATTASFSLPVLEWMFNVVTDIRLLEISNLNNPLLRRLAVQAPGTYNHSVIVGTLAEAAAETIGVGALLCRVAAYYHDIGKMKKPDYFIENSRRGAVIRHEKLSPTMSSLIILSHVKDGAKMARRYHLPKPIVDFIEQHHGTRLISYFFKKAKKMEDPEFQEVSESNFRYPGPKPQTKEAAVLMMADSVEAAARTVEEPTPAKFKDLIRKIVNAIILDDQLSETDLTFSDLDGIQRSFGTTLASIYHHRIEYPDFRFEDRPGSERVNLPA